MSAWAALGIAGLVCGGCSLGLLTLLVAVALRDAWRDTRRPPAPVIPFRRPLVTQERATRHELYGRPPGFVVIPGGRSDGERAS